MKWFEQIKKKLFPPKPPSYPCTKCFILLGGAKCGEICNQVEMDNEKLLEHVIQHKTCPDCGGTQVYGGPSGGISTNIQCLTCAHKFNSGAPILFERM